MAGETVTAAMHGLRLALRGQTRPVGVGCYADFSATAADWADYRTSWLHPAA
ncbi:MAG TPA: hypothetical protein VG756_02685 [Pseudonocardiaceae bacterium]|jgi:hypothetical protein|nr:hypothetical protein [Pseudonocardiaceae bacterium]